MVEYEERFKAWPLLGSGVLLCVMGLVCLLFPGLAFGTAGLLMGAAFIVAAVACLMMRSAVVASFAPRGATLFTAFSLVMGIIFCANPIASAKVVVWLIFAVLLIFAVATFILGMNERESGTGPIGTKRLLSAGGAIVLAILIMASPNLLVRLLALMALVVGGLLVYAALQAPKELVD